MNSKLFGSISEMISFFSEILYNICEISFEFKMEYLSAPFFVVESKDPELRNNFIELTWKCFGKKKKPDDPTLISFKVSNEWASIVEKNRLNESDSFIKIILAKNLHTFIENPATPTLILNISSDENQLQKGEGFCHLITSPNLDIDTIRSFMSYSLIFSHCCSLQIQDRKGISSSRLKDHIKRLFRTLDTNFDLKITYQQLSDYHLKVFNQQLSPYEYGEIFKIINGAEPLDPKGLDSFFITFDNFFLFFETLVKKGYGEIVYQMLKHSTFHKYYSHPEKPILPKNQSGNLIQSVRTFLTHVFNDMGDYPTTSSIRELFKDFTGGTPIRFRNMLAVTLNDWLSKWNDFALLEPEEAARSLLSLGYPEELIVEAFDMIKPNEASPLPIAFGFGGIALAGFSYLIYRSLKKM